MYSFKDCLNTLKAAALWVSVHRPADGGASTSEASTGLHGAVTRKAAIFILAAVRARSLV
jgi:hypothetical protein